MPAESVGTVTGARRTGGREFQILEDATEKLRAPNVVRANGTVSRFAVERIVKRSVALYTARLIQKTVMVSGVL